MRYQIVVIALLILFATLVLLSFFFLTQDDSLSRLQENNSIRIGYAVEAPYAYLEDGEVTGESAEVAKVIAASLDIENIEWIQTDFDSLIPELLENRFDVIAAGMFITAARAELVQFSNPTFHVQPGLLVQTGNPFQIQSYANIVNYPEARIAVLSASVEESLLRESGLAESQIIIVPDALTGETAVRTGFVDGLALSSVTVRWMAQNDTSHMTEALEIAAPSDLSEVWGYGGFAFRSDDRELVDAWNMGLASFIGTSAHLNLISEFGFTEKELPELTELSMVLSHEK